VLFNSVEFLLFLPTVFLLYWFVVSKNLKLQNFFVILASYLFYGWWDWRFLSLIVLSSIIDFSLGLLLQNSVSKVKRKIYLLLSIVFNLGILGFFKYCNFFIESWVNVFNSFGYNIKSSWTLNIILPVGISFYTFQTMSYSLDIFNKKIKPTNDFIAFSTFVAFFPQLVAGPIEKASSLLPQITSNKKFNYTQ